MSRIFVLGNATLDLTLTMPTWPAAGETVLASSLIRGPGGKGLNQAWAAARAGGKVTLVAPRGDDENGAYLERFIREADLLECRWRICEDSTDISTIWVAANGENMIASSAQCARTLAPAEVGDLLEGFGDGDFLVLQGNLRSDTTLAACRHARTREGRILLNTAPIDWSMAPLLPLVDVIVCNAPEAATLTGLKGREAALALSGSTVGTVVVTLGNDGAIVLDGNGESHIQAPTVASCDTSGAGDVFVGFLAANLSRQHSLLDAAKFAVAAASLSVTRQGALLSCPTAQEASTFILANAGATST